MATGGDIGDIGDIVKCPICLEQYVDARKLPVCLHTFCKTCMISYVSKRDDNTGLSENGFPCPLCRTNNPAPKGRKVTDWINSLERNEVFAFKADGTDNETRHENQCDSCKVFGITTKATKVCIDCFQLFCVPCSVGRHSDRLYNDHKVKEMDQTDEGLVEDLRKLSDYSRCKDHSGRDLNFFCGNDKTACCITCLLEYHRHCDNVMEIEDSNFDQEAKTVIKRLMSSVDKLKAFGTEVVDIKKTALTKTKQQIEKIKETLHDVRRKVNQALDLLDETVTEQTNAIMKKNNIKNDEETSALKNHIEDLKNCSALMETVSECGSVRKFFGICQNMREKIRVLEMFILDTCEVSTFSNVELKLKAPLQNLLDTEHFDAENLVTISEEETRIHLPIYEDSNLLRNYTVLKVCEKALQENDSSRNEPTYSDITFLHNNCSVVVDSYNGFCCLANDNNEIVSSCDFRLNDYFQIVPYFCSRLSDDKVAVSAPGQKTIAVLKASGKLSLVREMATEYTPQAIYGLKNGDLAVAWKDPVAFGIISIAELPTEKTYFCADKAGRELKTFEYIAVDEVRQQVIQPCRLDDAVYCFDYEGYPKFKYTNANLKNPKGVGLDVDGNIYVCSNYESSIHIISPNGQFIRTVIEGCPEEPLAIAFKRNGKEFAITSERDGRYVTFFKLYEIQDK